MMDKSIESLFRFNDYKVNEIKYIRNPEFVYGEPIAITFDLDIQVEVREDSLAGKVTIITNIFENAIKESLPFSLFLSVSGYFSVDDTDNMTKEEFRQFCERNGTTVMFPFLRATVSDITKSANIAPLVLPLININNLIEKKE